MHELLMSPAEYRHHLERYTISIGSTIAFGRRIPSSDDPIVATLLEVQSHDHTTSSSQTHIQKWFRQTVIAGSGLQIADWWPSLRPIIRAIPFAINPIKKWLARLHFMERDLWVDCVEVARQHMLNNRFYPSTFLAATILTHLCLILITAQVFVETCLFRPRSKPRIV